MVSLLIAEDESFERDAVEELVRIHFGDRIAVSGSVGDGEEACTAVRLLRPQIVLMDISMPIRDGLSAAAEIKDVDQDIEVLILTAHASFEYAQEAIKIGVSDFLVKPYDDDDFAAAVERILVRIAEREARKAREENVLSAMRETSRFAEREFLAVATGSGPLDVVNAGKLLSVLSISPQMPYVCISAEPADAPERLTERAEELKKAIKSASWTILCGHTFGRAIFFVFSSRLAYERPDTMLRRIKSSGWNVSCSRTFNELGRLREAYRDAIGDERSSRSRERGTLSWKESEIVGVLLKGNFSEGLSLITTVLRTHTGEDARSELCGFLKGIRRSLHLSTLSADSGLPDPSDSAHSEEADDPKVLYDALAADIDRLSAVADRCLPKLVSDIQSYIRANLSEDLTLLSVADRFRVTPGHVGRIFRESKVGSFKEYVTTVRLEYAANLLRDPRLGIGEVARMSGFRDPNYFGKVFKTRFGSTPVNYRDRR